MKQIKIYPLARQANPPAMKFVNGSGKAVEMIHPDNFEYFEMLAQIVAEEPAEIFSPLERFQMQAVGIDKGKLFNPDAKTPSRGPTASRRPFPTLTSTRIASGSISETCLTTS